MASRWTGIVLSLTGAILSAVALPSASAQALPAASREAEIGGFIGINRNQPDYGYKGHGVTFGLDYTRYFHHFPIVPSLEARGNINHDPTVNESSYVFGLKAAYPLRGRLERLNPYVDFEAGPGTIHYNFNTGYPGYQSDNSVVWAYGAGVDVDIVRHIAVKVDFQQQSWKPGSNYTLSPWIGTIGVVYHVPFRPHKRQSDFYR